MVKCYLYERLRWLVTCLITSVIVFTSYFVFNLPREAILYIMALNFILWLLFLVFDFIGYVEKHMVLKQLKHAILYRSAPLEHNRSGVENEYIDMINELIHAKFELATEKDQARTEILDYYSLWVHQIKTPIAALDLMLQNPEPSDPKEMAMELFKVEQYVSMALQYLRVDSDSTDFVFKMVSVSKCVGQVLKKFKKIFISKNIKVNLHIQEDSKILTDEKWLVFALEQIISNALKYTDSGEITIAFARGQLIIEDTGCGIRPEDIPRVFEKGFTGFNGRESKKSTGIGLYLTKKILNKLSLAVDIQSDVGKGTRVIILTSM